MFVFLKNTKKKKKNIKIRIYEYRKIQCENLKYINIKLKYSRKIFKTSYR